MGPRRVSTQGPSGAVCLVLSRDETFRKVLFKISLCSGSAIFSGLDHHLIYCLVVYEGMVFLGNKAIKKLWGMLFRILVKIIYAWYVALRKIKQTIVAKFRIQMARLSERLSIKTGSLVIVILFKYSNRRLGIFLWVAEIFTQKSLNQCWASCFMIKQDYSV